MRSAVVAARWPNGFVCDRCQCTRFSPTHNGRRLWQCKDCGYQSSSIVGSVMEHTKLPLTTWFLAMHWMTQSKGGIGALPRMRYLGVSYPTAWLIRHKLMQVMFEREQATVLSGRIEIDDAFLGGEHPGRQGRGGNKVPFVAAVETDLKGRPQIVRFDRVDNHGIKSIQQWAAMAIAPLANGKALVGGFFGLIENTPRGMLVWLNSDGTVDASFATATNANSSAGAIAQLAADKPLVGGSFTQVGTPTPLVNHSRLVRLNADGTLDATFVGPTALNGSVSALRPLGDGRAYVSGTFASIKLTASSASNPAYRHVVRLDPTGALETAFSAGTAGASMLYATATPNSALPSSVVVMATFSNDASLFVAGNFHSFAGAPHGNFARLNAIKIATATAIVSHGSVVS